MHERYRCLETSNVQRYLEEINRQPHPLTLSGLNQSLTTFGSGDDSINCVLIRKDASGIPSLLPLSQISTKRERSLFLPNTNGRPETFQYAMDHQLSIMDQRTYGWRF